MDMSATKLGALRNDLRTVFVDLIFMGASAFPFLPPSNHGETQRFVLTHSPASACIGQTSPRRTTMHAQGVEIDGDTLAQDFVATNLFPVRRLQYDGRPGRTNMTTEDPNLGLAATIAAPLNTDDVPPKLRNAVVGRRWKLERPIGAGTFGWVFFATHLERKERAAVKVLRPEHALDDALVARFRRRELELLRRVHAQREPNANVVRYLEDELIEHDGFLMMVLEFVDGASLADIIAKERILDEGEARAIGADIARGLAAIHTVGGVHRDLKPDNIRLRKDLTAVILDLGIAKAQWETQKLTRTHETLMTALYASPEQFGGDEVGAASDIYALGLILYEMLVGTVPLQGKTYSETMQARIRRAAPDPRSSGRPVSEEIASLTLRCLARNPANRPSAAEVVITLEGRQKRQTSRHWPWLGVASAVALVGVWVTTSVVSPDNRSAQMTPAPSSSPSAETSSVPIAPPSSVPMPSASAPAPRQTFLKVSTSKPVYRPNEKISFTFESATDAYVLLVGLASDGSGELIFPVAGKPAPFITAQTKLQFPSVKDTFDLRTKLEPGEKVSETRVIAIAVTDAMALSKYVPHADKPLSKTNVETLRAEIDKLSTTHDVVEFSYRTQAP